jgi:hypothetical protein
MNTCLSFEKGSGAIKMYDIFISYSPSDQDFARELYLELKNFRVRGFMDSTDVAAGANLSRRLKDAIRNADALVVIMSSRALQSSWVLAEIGLAQSLGKPVIPVLAPGQTYDESIPPQLMDRIVLDANITAVDELAARIVATVTGSSVEFALGEVRSRARRRQRLLAVTAIVFGLLSMAAVMLAYFALTQRISAEHARSEAEARARRLEQLTGKSASLAIAPDGKVLATGDSNGGVTLWNAMSGDILARFSGNQGTISGLAFSPDGRLLASASWDGTVVVWDIQTGEKLLQLMGHSDAIIAVQFAPDGRILYTRSVDGLIKEWSIEDGSLIREIHAPT